MQKQPLSQTNPYLKKKKLSKKLILLNVTTSTAIELGKVSSSLLQALKNNASH
jgi:hypothetical protein